MEKGIWGHSLFLLEVIFNIHLDMGQNIYDYGIVSVLGAICCCYFIFYISNLLSYTNLKKILYYYGTILPSNIMYSSD